MCETRLLSFVSVRSWLSREKVWGQAYVCAHTRPPRPRLLTELTCLELVYPRLRIRRTSTRQYTLLETESPRANAAGHCANFLWSIDHSTQPILAVNRIRRGNSDGFRASGTLNGTTFSRNITARTFETALSIGILCAAISPTSIKSIEGAGLHFSKHA